MIIMTLDKDKETIRSIKQLYLILFFFGYAWEIIKRSKLLIYIDSIYLKIHCFIFSQNEKLNFFRSILTN